MQIFFENKFPNVTARVVLCMILAYVAWNFIEFICNNTLVFLHETISWLYDSTGSCLVYFAGNMLRLLGQEVVFYKRMITLNTAAGYYLTDTQIMIAPFTTLTGTAICLLNFKSAVKTIAIGIPVIFLLNTLQVVGLAEATVHRALLPQQAGVYLFTLFAYVFCFWQLHRKIKVQ